MFKGTLRILLAMILTFTFLATVEVNATEGVDVFHDNETDTYGNGAYAITGYKVDMVVNEDNTYDITENIEVYFNLERRGIIRNIQKKNKIIRLDRSKSSNKAKISNVYVNNRYSTTEDSEFYNIKIGDPSKSITGYENYEIKYTYDIGNDRSRKFDELYFNIIGNRWDTTISNMEFTITMPKEFDESKLGFSSGYLGSTDSRFIVYNVDNKIIKGEYIGILRAEEALTVRLELPEGYFIKGYGKIITPIISILCLIISVLLWIKHGKDEKIIETVEFYPPLDYNSAELAFLYKGKVENKDIISLLIYLANKGYVKIVETEYNALFSKNDNFEIVKVKDYDGDNSYEKLFYDGLFKDGEKVSITQLENEFYTTSQKIKNDLNKKENKHNIFNDTSLKMRKLVFLLAIIIFLAITICPVYFAREMENILFATLFPGLGLIAMLASIFIVKEKFSRVFMFIWGALFGGIVWVFLVLPILQQEGYLFIYIFGITCIVGMTLIIKYMPKRTTFGLEILGKINGFKNFLKVAKVSKLEALVMENPTYFYDIMPYVYVLELSDKWISKFESITIEEPNWYYSSNAFNIHTFNASMNSTMKTATSTMTSSPVSSGGSSGGGSSGGGSSGGGSGGGGGSSW